MFLCHLVIAIASAAGAGEVCLPPPPPHLHLIELLIVRLQLEHVVQQAGRHAVVVGADALILRCLSI